MNQTISFHADNEDHTVTSVKVTPKVLSQNQTIHVITPSQDDRTVPATPQFTLRKNRTSTEDVQRSCYRSWHWL
jgi:hypothetical protein